MVYYAPDFRTRAPRFQTPAFSPDGPDSSSVFPAGLLPSNAADLSNIGPLFAFALVGRRRADSPLPVNRRHSFPRPPEYLVQPS